MVNVSSGGREGLYQTTLVIRKNPLKERYYHLDPKSSLTVISSPFATLLS